MATKITDTGIVCPKTELDIVRTLECGQVFRYFPLGGGAYRVISGDKICELCYDGDNTALKTADPDYFYGYFDFDTDYDSIMRELGRFEELREALRFGKGLRILRQQPFETAVSFIISANNNIKRIKGIVERICAACGSDKGDYFAFPTREQLMTLSAQDYRRLGCGFRSEYLYSSVPKLTDGYLAHIGALTQDAARKELCLLKGVGPKVAECVMLFAYKMTGSYPVDTWIFKAGRTEQLNTPESVHKYYSERYGSLSGYAQQYIFQAARNESAFIA